MPVTQYTPNYAHLPQEIMDAYATIPAAVVSDSIGERMALTGAINPLDPSMRICGQARTVECEPGDNTPVRVALRAARPGDVIVVDAKGYEDRAVLGGLMALFAQEQGVGGLVIDGAVRDSQEIIAAGLNVFCRVIVPCRPIKQEQGMLDGPIRCGGIPVSPGDLVIGDADGVVIVPLARVDEVLKGAQAIIAKEEKLMEDLKNGATLAGYFGPVEVNIVDV